MCLYVCLHIWRLLFYWAFFFVKLDYRFSSPLFLTDSLARRQLLATGVTIASCFLLSRRTTSCMLSFLEFLYRIFSPSIMKTLFPPSLHSLISLYICLRGGFSLSPPTPLWILFFFLELREDKMRLSVYPFVSWNNYGWLLRIYCWYGSVAAETKKGFLSVTDKKDGYTFLYPFGWQVSLITFSSIYCTCFVLDVLVYVEDKI